MSQENSVYAKDKSQRTSRETVVYPEVIVISSDSEDEREVVSASFTHQLGESGSSDAVAAVYDEVVASVCNILPDAEVSTVMRLADEAFSSCSSKNEVVEKICDKLLQGLTGTSDVIAPNVPPRPLSFIENVPNLENGTVCMFPSSLQTQNSKSAILSSPKIDYLNRTSISNPYSPAGQRILNADCHCHFADASEGKLQRERLSALLDHDPFMKKCETNEGKNLVYRVEVQTVPQKTSFPVGGLNETNEGHLPSSAQTVRESVVTQTVNERALLSVTEPQDSLHLRPTFGKIPSHVGELNERKPASEINSRPTSSSIPETFSFALQTLPTVLFNMFYENGLNPMEHVPVKSLQRAEPTATIVRPVKEEAPAKSSQRKVRKAPRRESAVPLQGAQENANNDVQTLKRPLTKNPVPCKGGCRKKRILTSGNIQEPFHPEKEESGTEQNATGDSFPSENSDNEEYECSCCYNTVPFDYMVQCGEGHLFCCECLRRYTQEAVYGGGKASLMCMSDGCTATFPPSQLIRALPTSLYNKYEERIEEEFISLANLEDFVRCPYCNVGAELVSTQIVFNCPNLVCQKRVCRLCKADWVDHEGLTCEQVEKKDETKIRLAFEEKMAEAKIRQCPKCNAKYTKEDGCNKITCRCSMTMCYVCRQAKIDYRHFCNCVTSLKRGKSIVGKCPTCHHCLLWSKGEDDDNLAIQELKNDAQAERFTQGFTDEKEIGAPAHVQKPRTPKPKRGRRGRRNS